MTDLVKKRKLDHVPKEQNESVIENKFQLNELPDEVKQTIFSFLNIEDRKHCKLVCQNWYCILTYRFFLAKEKVVCRAFQDVDTLVENLKQRKCPLINLEFQGISIDNIDHDFWIQRGQEIVTLKFFRCLIKSDAAFLIVIQNCNNLQELFFESACQVSEFIVKAAKSNIVCENLLSFELQERLSSADILDVLPQIFPRLNELILNCLSLSPNLKHKLLVSDYLKSLKMMTVDLRIIQDNKLENLQVLDIEVSKIEESLFHFLRKHHILRKMRIIELYYSDKGTGMKLMECALDNCNNLRSFHICCRSEDNEEKFEWRILKKIVESKLEYLSVHFHFLKFEDMNSEHEEPCKNNLLRYLHLEANNKLDIEVYNLFFNIFTHLKHLKLKQNENVNEILSSLYNYHKTSLQSLHFCSFPSLKTKPIFFETSSIMNLNKLRNLRYLYINILIAEDETLNIDLPSLEYLSVSLSGVGQEEQIKIFLNCLATNSKLLRCLYIAVSDHFPDDLWKNFASVAQHLKYLCIERKKNVYHKMKDIGRREMEQIFVSSSLQVLLIRERYERAFHWCGYLDEYLFCYDRSQKLFFNVAKDCKNLEFNDFIKTIFFKSPVVLSNKSLPIFFG